MSISVSCDGCGKRFKAPDRGAGKKVLCPACKTMIFIPTTAAEEENDEYRLADEPARPAAAKLPRPSMATAAQTTAGNLPEAAGSGSGRSNAPAAKAWVPTTRSSTPIWLRHLHWCLGLAMIPLAVSVLAPSRPEIASIAQSSEAPASSGSASPQTGSVAAADDDAARQDESFEHMSVDDLFAALPDHKLPGALLSRNSYVHWLFAVAAAAVFMSFFVVLASDKSANPLHLLGLGLFTATGGIILLFAVQTLSAIGAVRVGGIIGLILLALLLIGLSYSAALSPDTGFIVSFLGFTFGVGLCEEVCKALPLLVYYRIGNQQPWRGAFLWGLASGTGFGVSEGVMYSQDFYNGISGPHDYLVRFASCVALHAIWAGSVGISINQRQYLLQEEHDDEAWWMYGLAVLRLIAIPMVLHGLYDTLLKKDLEFVALLTAAASFGYLAWQISNLRGGDDEDERAAYVAKYIRSQAAVQKA